MKEMRSIGQRLKEKIKTVPGVYRLVVTLRDSAAGVVRSLSRRKDRLKPYLLQMTRTVEQPVFVKVGANDGITGDPCGDIFLDNRNWKGLLIEPVPYCIEKLRSIYADPDRFIVDQVAVGAVPGTATFYYVSQDARKVHPDLPGWYDQLGSFSREHILKHLNGVLEPFVVAADVKVEPLHAILCRHGLTRVDFLHVDTEGHDLQVLKSLSLGENMPLSIYIEHKHLSLSDRMEMLSMLKQNGYHVRNAGTDFFAVHRNAKKTMRQRRRLGKS